MNALSGTGGAGNQINAAGVTRMAQQTAPAPAIIDASATNIAPVTTTNAHFTNTSMVPSPFLQKLAETG